MLCASVWCIYKFDRYLRISILFPFILLFCLMNSEEYDNRMESTIVVLYDFSTSQDSCSFVCKVILNLLLLKYIWYLVLIISALQWRIGNFYHKNFKSEDSNMFSFSFGSILFLITNKIMFQSRSTPNKIKLINEFFSPPFNVWCRWRSKKLFRV